MATPVIPATNPTSQPAVTFDGWCLVDLHINRNAAGQYNVLSAKFQQQASASGQLGPATTTLAPFNNATSPANLAAYPSIAAVFAAIQAAAVEVGTATRKF